MQGIHTPGHFGQAKDEALDLLGSAASDALDHEPTLEEVALFYLSHPVEWANDMVGILFDPWQSEALNNLVIKHYVAIRSGHGVGKSTVMSLTILWFLTTHPFCKIICTAPTKTQLYDVLWAECHRWIRESKTLTQILEWTQDRIYVKNHAEEWFAAARTAEVRKLGKKGLVVAESMQGRHAENVLYVIDEASGVDEAVMETIDGALTTANCYVLMAGNPTRPSGTFFKAFHTHRKLWHTIHISSEDSPRVKPEYCKKMLDKYGSRDNPIYMVRVRGEFPPAAENALFSLDNIEAACSSELSANQYDPVEVGVDVARYGSNDTVIAIKKGSEIIKIIVYPKQDTMATAGSVIQVINEYRPCAVKIDVTGIGAGVFDRLRELRYRECMAITNAAVPSDPKMFANIRAESYWYFRTLLEKRLVKLPGGRGPDGNIICDDDLVSEMTSITYTLSSRGKIQIESKEQLIERGIKSPDRLDAVVLACLPARLAISTQHARFETVSFMGR